MKDEIKSLKFTIKQLEAKVSELEMKLEFKWKVNAYEEFLKCQTEILKQTKEYAIRS